MHNDDDDNGDSKQQRRPFTQQQQRPSPPQPITREDYQLFSMTCLYIAIKLLVGTTTMTTTTTKTTTTSAAAATTTGKNGITGTGRSTTTNVMKITIQTFVDMSKNYYSKEMIERTERDIVYGLNWHLHAPTSTSYVRLFLQLLSLCFVHPMIQPQQILNEIERTAYDITEMAIVHTYFCDEMALDIALASIYHAIRVLPPHNHYNRMHSNTGSHPMHDSSLSSLDWCWNMILHQLPFLQYKQECPQFRRVYIELAKRYYYK